MTHVLGDDDFGTKIDERYFEDYRPGAIYEYGHTTVTEAEIVEFATRSTPSRSTSTRRTPPPARSAA
jgi:hypothetical protein